MNFTASLGNQYDSCDMQRPFHMTLSNQVCMCFIKLFSCFDTPVPLWLKMSTKFVCNVSSMSDLCTGHNFDCNTCCICVILFSFWLHNLSEIVQRVWCFHFCILKDGLFIAVAVFLGQRDFLCKDESKHIFHDVTHNATCIMLFVKQPYFISARLTVLHFLILLCFKFARITILFKALLHLFH